MVKIDVKMPSEADLMRVAMADVEAQITKKAKAAASRHGGVSVRVTRKPDGRIGTFEFHGSENAIKAAKAAKAAIAG